MAYFEPYRDRDAGGVRRQPFRDVLIRPAALQDATALSQIDASRQGGDPTTIVESIEKAIRTACQTGQRLILVAERDASVLGFGKVSYFNPPDDAPDNVAPPGWYLSGVVVAPEHRGRGIGRRLTRARLDWIGERDEQAFYVANVRNRVSIDLHAALGFIELTRNFTFPGIRFEGGIGVLFRAAVLRSTAVLDSAPT